MGMRVKTVDRICAVGLVLLAFVVVLVALGLGLRHHARVAGEEEARAGRQEELDKARALLGEMQTVVGTARRAVSDLRSRIPETGQIGAFLGAVDTLTRSRHVLLIDLQPQSRIQEEPFARVPVRLTCSGAFTNVHRFLYDLEMMEREVRVENAILAGDAANGTCRLQVIASLFER